MKQAVNLRRFQPDDDLIVIATAPPGACAKHAPAAAKVKIYTMPPSLCSQRVRMTLLEKRVPYAEHVVNTATGENLRPEYIALNPRALVPTLTFDDRRLFDSATIMRFANNWFEGPELAPADHEAFAEMNRWIDRADDFPVRGFTYRAQLESGLPDFWVVALRDNIVRARDLYPEHRDLYDLKLKDWADLVAWMKNPGDTREGERIANAMADEADAALARHSFLVGGEISLADLTVFILFMRLQCGCNVELCTPNYRPHLHDWIERMKQRPSYEGAVLAPYRTTALVQLTSDCWFPAARAA